MYKSPEQYNLISALHKSLRGSDPDAALYWFARMIQGGEDPRYIARRLTRFAAEDVGLADPRALPLAIAAYNAGPARVEEWLGGFGDPSAGGGIAMLDWIELIPFNETRNYVQRVIENMAIYRARDPAASGLPHPMTRWLSA